VYIGEKTYKVRYVSATCPKYGVNAKTTIRKIVKNKNFLLRLINLPICIYFIGKLTISNAAVIIKIKQNFDQKTISDEFSFMELLSIMKGAATKSAAPGTGNPLKNPGILF
tara:strand:- start:124 stop:456 length:333 start_codon:yes stop_codon:yes gene_type:complete